MKKAAVLFFLLFAFIIYSNISAAQVNQEKESAFVFYDIPTEHSFPGGIAVDSKGNVWFSEYRGNKIAMLNKAGVIR
ncbi:MAG: hypothetical protein HZA05_03530, partial [Nitrospirae bacterium]|nr:hypothetical protein [Nitrospirota bacterium]